MIDILLVEDEKRMNEALAELLRQEGYRVNALRDGRAGMDAILNEPCDLAVLDVMLPGDSGTEIAAAARRAGITVPILMLTARSGLEDKIAGLDSGADDYMVKPFEPRELLARLRAMIRRIPAGEKREMCFGDLCLDPDALCLKRGDMQIRLTVREARLMAALIRCRERTTAREQLAVQAFGYDDEAEYNKVEVYMSFLRKKLTFLHSRVSVKTERGVGYRLQEEKDVP